jgi:hypothetical protein
VNFQKKAFKKKPCLKRPFRASLTAMKRISLILASFVLVFGTKASAAKGGPFDNGDYSSLLDNSGIYQAAFRFSNGSGFAQFGDNVDAALFVDISNTGGSTVRGSTYSVLNRSIIYYKGVSYLGTCYGMVDHEAKLVSGVTNGNSDVGTVGTTNASNNANTQSVTAATTTLLNNGGLGFPCNTNFNCRITKTHPVLRFNGTGELTIVNPSLSQVAYSALTALITSQQGATGNQNFGTQITQLVAGLTSAAASTTSLIPSTDQTRATSDQIRMTVFGSRKFFVGRR